MTIKENEKYVNKHVSNFINNSINESIGHPLLYNDVDEFSEFIFKIEKCINTLNKQIINTEVINAVKLNFRNNIYKGLLLKPIKIQLNNFYLDKNHDSENFTLSVNIVNIIKDKIFPDDYDNLKHMTSGGFISIYNDSFRGSKIFNEQSSDRLIINCYSMNGKIIPSTFLFAFLHEYVHFSEYFNRVKKNKHKEKIFKTSYVNKSIKDINNYYFTEEEREALKNLLYYLFAGNEINALIGNLFSDLIMLNISDLYEFYQNKNKLYSFEIYNKLKNDINVIRNTNNKEFYNFIVNNYKLISKSDDTIDDTFLSSKRKFISICERQLNKFYKKQMKFVGNYIAMITRCDNLIVNTIIQD